MAFTNDSEFQLDEGRGGNIKIFCPTFLWLVKNNPGAYLSRWSFVSLPRSIWQAQWGGKKKHKRRWIGSVSLLLCLLVFLISPRMKYIYNIKSVKWKEHLQGGGEEPGLSLVQKQLLNSICPSPSQQPSYTPRRHMCKMKMCFPLENGNDRWSREAGDWEEMKGSEQRTQAE